MQSKLIRTFIFTIIFLAIFCLSGCNGNNNEDLYDYIQTEVYECLVQTEDFNLRYGEDFCLSLQTVYNLSDDEKNGVILLKYEIVSDSIPSDLNAVALAYFDLEKSELVGSYLYNCHYDSVQVLDTNRYCGLTFITNTVCYTGSYSQETFFLKYENGAIEKEDFHFPEEKEYVYAYALDGGAVMIAKTAVYPVPGEILNVYVWNPDNNEFESRQEFLGINDIYVDVTGHSILTSEDKERLYDLTVEEFQEEFEVFRLAKEYLADPDELTTYWMESIHTSKFDPWVGVTIYSQDEWEALMTEKYGDAWKDW